MTELEHQVLRIVSGEDVPGWTWGAAMGACLGFLRSSGYVKLQPTANGSEYAMTKLGQQYLAEHPIFPAGERS